MSAINHFQTYSQRENHVTNNTMLMLRHVYRTSPRLLEDILQSLLEDDEVKIGPRFEQQVGHTHSIPDAILSQKPLNIYIEAKRGDGLYDDQLERHLMSIAEKQYADNSTFLIGLTVNKASEEDAERWNSLALKYKVTFATITYRELLDALGTISANFPELQEIFDDYQSFIGGEKLLPDQYRKIVAMLCGQSWRENIAHGVYFEPAQRNPKWTRADYLGVYRNKRVRSIGRIEVVAICRMVNDEIIVDTVEIGALADRHKKRIHNIIKAASYYPGLGMEPHRYYLVDNFLETDVRKSSPGGLMGHRYLDIGDLTARDPKTDATTSEVAFALSGTSFI